MRALSCSAHKENRTPERWEEGARRARARARARAHTVAPRFPCLPYVYHPADATRQVHAVPVEERRQVVQPSRHVLGLRRKRRGSHHRSRSRALTMRERQHTRLGEHARWHADVEVAEVFAAILKEEAKILPAARILAQLLAREPSEVIPVTHRRRRQHATHEANANARARARACARRTRESLHSLRGREGVPSRRDIAWRGGGINALHLAHLLLDVFERRLDRHDELARGVEAAERARDVARRVAPLVDEELQLETDVRIDARPLRRDERKSVGIRNPSTAHERGDDERS